MKLVALARENANEMLGTWSDIRQSLGRYPARFPKGDDLVTFAYSETGESPSLFQVKHAELSGRQRIFIGTNVAPDEPVLSHEALAINSELIVGALVAWNGNIVLRHVMTVGDFSAEELHEVIASLAQSSRHAQERLNRLLPDSGSLYPVE